MAEHAHPRDTVFDVDTQRLAKIYAVGTLNAAGDIASQGALVEELEQLEIHVLNKHPQIEEVFGSELISEREKLEILDRILEKEASTTLLNTCRVMAHHGRLGFLRSMIRAARELFETRSNRTRVELQTAYPIDANLEAEIVRSLKGMLGTDPTLVQRVNPDLLAGFVIRVGDRVYDASARTGLQRAGRDMVARAVEAIQTRPEQFITTIPSA